MFFINGKIVILFLLVYVDFLGCCRFCVDYLVYNRFGFFWNVEVEFKL